MINTDDAGSVVMLILAVAILCVGMMAGGWYGQYLEQNRTVIDNDHLIYDHVLYRKVVPTE